MTLIRMFRWRGLPARLAALAAVAGLTWIVAIPAEASNFTWRWTNNAGETLHVQIFSQNRDTRWPGSTRYWIVHPDGVQYHNPVSCNRGEKICYGGWSAERPDVYWGVGKDGKMGCTGCCYTCSNGQSQVINFTPAPPSAVSQGAEEDERFEDWVAEGGPARVIIGSLRLEITGDNATITFQTGKSIDLVRVAGVAGLWKLVTPQDPILRRGTRLCGNGPIHYMGIMIRGNMERGLKPYVSPTPPSEVGVFGGGCGYFPFYEKIAYDRLGPDSD